MASDDVVALPLGTTFYYLAEGAANIVYRIGLPPGTPPPSILEEYEEGEPIPSDLDLSPNHISPLDNKLLRVRKDRPTTVPVATAHADWVQYIKPLFHEHDLVDQSLVKLRPANVIETLNNKLKGSEILNSIANLPRPSDSRPEKRSGIYLADDEYGLLITDMTPQTEKETVIEFKPKWLAQSPSAPPNSKRCRQCARVARSNAERKRNRQHPEKTLCPLDLVSKDRTELIRAADLMLAPNKPAGTSRGYSAETTTLRLANWLGTNDLLSRLATYQIEFDRVGPLKADVNDKKFLAAMTLRDCTVYLRMPNDPNKAIGEARIGDLDLKSPAKKDYWHDTEETLIREGWYEGREIREDAQPLVCRLDPERYQSE